jgi:uncharacterized protein (DUF433 family)
MFMRSIDPKAAEHGTQAVTPVEAAWLTELSPKMINATIDRGELAPPERKRSESAKRPRRLGPADVVYLVLRKELSEVLSPTAKRELYERLAELARRDVFSVEMENEVEGDLEIELAGGLLRIEVKRAWRRVSKRWIALRRAADIVVSDPDIRGGEPVIRGTRVPAYLIADLIDEGADLREILEDYPTLNAAKVRSAVAFARTHPRRGRPRKAPWRA